MESISAWDHATFQLINSEWRRLWLDPVFWVITTSGLGWVQILGMAPLARWVRWRPLFYMGLFNWIVVGTTANLIKRMVPRDRPSRYFAEFVAPDERIFHGSFPSGHTTTSFALATILVLATRGGRRAWIGQLAVLWAALVGISRIYRGVHWPSDVAAGALLGIAGGILSFALVSRWAPLPSQSEPEDL